MSIVSTVSDVLDPVATQKWYETLQPASFRGVPFAVTSGQSNFGRKTALHEYPYRDKPWVEDLGKGTRKFSLQGFLVENSLVYGGGDVIVQRNNLIAACETSGSGTLVHPSYGELTVSIPDGGLQVTEQWDGGRCFEFTLNVIESGVKVFPVTASVGIPQDPWLEATAKSVLQFIATVDGITRHAGALIQTLQSTAGFWVSEVSGTIHEASNLKDQISGAFSGDTWGRYQPSSNSGLSSSGSSTVAQQTAVITENLAVVSAAGDTLTSSTTVVQYAASAEVMNRAVIATITRPANTIQIFSQLAVFRDERWQGLMNACTAHAAAQLFRRLSLASLGQAALRYQPFSYDDASAVMRFTCEALDVGLTEAANEGHTDVWQSFNALQNAIVLTLSAKEASLSRFKTWDVPSALPSLTLSERLYQDAARNDELVRSVNPVHPAFMPLNFRALSE
ncbi:hypothetical protein AU577_16905 [Salmonella enterica subsp. enterica serovar Alachua]|nr:hypothetical protein [Salmonella enterica subsp. enterica serovar Alachua]